MRRKLLSLMLPIGLLIELVYMIGNRFIVKFPDVVAYPMLIVSIGFMLSGIVYNVHYIQKHKN